MMEQDEARIPEKPELSQHIDDYKQKQPHLDTVDKNEMASPPQDEQTQKQPVQAGISQSPAGVTKVFLGDQSSAGPTIYNEDTVAHAPTVPPSPLPFSANASTMPGEGYPAQPIPPASGVLRKRSRNKGAWWVVGILGGLAALIIVVLLGAGLFVLTSHSSTDIPAGVSSNPHATTSSPAASSSPISSTPVVAASTATNYLAVIPNHFNARTDCQVDNGYRCTAVVVASQLTPGSVSWFASSSTLSMKFSPASGVVYPNQQQQVIVYIFNACPYSGSLTFSTSRGNIAVPVVC